jgi:hypothetical protein
MCDGKGSGGIPSKSDGKRLRKAWTCGGGWRLTLMPFTKQPAEGDFPVKPSVRRKERAVLSIPGRQKFTPMGGDGLTPPLRESSL